jgi:amino acid transporter
MTVFQVVVVVGVVPTWILAARLWWQHFGDEDADVLFGILWGGLGAMLFPITLPILLYLNVREKGRTR